MAKTGDVERLAIAPGQGVAADHDDARGPLGGHRLGDLGADQQAGEIVGHGRFGEAAGERQGAGAEEPAEQARPLEPGSDAAREAGRICGRVAHQPAGDRSGP
ncbi:MAG: hypothetical protein R3D25_22310 [Geminicoccaceae bacterium]